MSLGRAGGFRASLDESAGQAKPPVPQNFSPALTGGQAMPGRTPSFDRVLLGLLDGIGDQLPRADWHFGNTMAGENSNRVLTLSQSRAPTMCERLLIQLVGIVAGTRGDGELAPVV